MIGSPTASCLEPYGSSLSLQYTPQLNYPNVEPPPLFPASSFPNSTFIAQPFTYTSFSNNPLPQNSFQSLPNPFQSQYAPFSQQSTLMQSELTCQPPSHTTLDFISCPSSTAFTSVNMVSPDTRQEILGISSDDFDQITLANTLPQKDEVFFVSSIHSLLPILLNFSYYHSVLFSFSILFVLSPVISFLFYLCPPHYSSFLLLIIPLEIGCFLWNS